MGLTNIVFKKVHLISKNSEDRIVEIEKKVCWARAETKKLGCE